MTEDQIKNIFTYHPPDAGQREVYEKINAAVTELALLLNELLPEGPGKAVAFRKLQEARHQANACVALNGTF